MNKPKDVYINPFNKDSIESKEIIIPESGYLLYPNNFILGATNEIVNLKKCNEEFIKYKKAVDMEVAGKSSIARLGLIIE